MAPEPRDAEFMRRAIRLAMNGRGYVEPNPMVGCVIVKAGRIIGEGYHQKFGGPHAEPDALTHCTESPTGATAYVTLEPCCHTNKKTPPCVPRLIEAKIARVVIGCLDPNPAVSGKGVHLLCQAGIDVDGPLLESECKQLIAVYLKQSPYVTLKWAQSADGKVAGAGGRRVQISNSFSQQAVHQLRARSDAILIGIGTALLDDPLLLPRGVPTERSILRIVLDTDLRLPPGAQLVKTANQSPVIVFTATGRAGGNDADLLLKAGVEVIGLSGPSPVSLELVLRELHRRQVTLLVVEPGPTLAASFLNAGLVDRIWRFRSPGAIGDATAPAATAVPTHFVTSGEINIAGDTMAEFLNPRSAAFFAAEPSADFILTQDAFIAAGDSQRG